MCTVIGFNIPFKPRRYLINDLDGIKPGNMDNLISHLLES